MNFLINANALKDTRKTKNLFLARNATITKKNVCNNAHQIPYKMKNYKYADKFNIYPNLNIICFG